MGKRSKRYEDEIEVRCEECDEYFIIEYYQDRGDLVTCEECGTDFLIKSRNPLILEMLDEEEEEEDLYFEDDDY